MALLAYVCMSWMYVMVYVGMNVWVDAMGGWVGG